jgi:hypothetical protein
MSEAVSDAVNDAVAHTVGIVGLGGIALIHALQVPEAFEETAYRNRSTRPERDSLCSPRAPSCSPLG